MTIPTGSYTDLVNGYFGYLEVDEKTALWNAFLTSNGITSAPEDFQNPPWRDYLAANSIDPETLTPAQLQTTYIAFLNQPSLQTLFTKFIQNAYLKLANIDVFPSTATSIALQQDQSPDEIKNRHLVYTIFDILIMLMGNIQDTVTVLTGNISILAKRRNEYTEMMSRVAFYQANSSNAPVINTEDLSKWTLGYANISIRDYISAGIAGGDAVDSNKVVITPGVGEELILGNASTTVPAERFANLTSTTEATVRAFIVSSLTESVRNGLDTLQNRVLDFIARTLSVQNNTAPTPQFSDPISWAGLNEDSVVNAIDSTDDILNIPNDWFGHLMLANIGIVLSPDERSFLNGSVLTPLRSAAKNVYDTNRGAASSTAAGFTFQRTDDTLKISFIGGAPQTILERDITFNEEDTYAQKLEKAEAAFKELLTETIGANTVLTLVTNANVHIPWNSALNTAFPQGTPSDTVQGNINKRQTQNQLLQSYLESARVKREVLANIQDSEQTTLDQAMQGISQAAQLISSAIRQLQNILGAIFKIS